MSQQSYPVLSLTRRAAGVINAARFVTYGNVQAGAAANTLGVARSGAASGEQLTLDVLGTTVVESGAAITEGDLLQTDSSGRGITRTSTNPIVGRALEAATAAGQFIEVLLLPN